jgi:hypothetical protein
VKHFLSLFFFGIGALCFVVFFATLKPTVVTATVRSEGSSHCSTKASLMLTCRPHFFTAALWPASRSDRPHVQPFYLRRTYHD